MPALVRRFRQAAAIAEADGRLADAAWHRLRGGWAADDAGATRVASEERRAAAKLISLLRARNLWAPDVPGAAELVLADLLRGSGDWSGAEEAVREALARIAEPELKALAERERDLVERRETFNL